MVGNLPKECELCNKTITHGNKKRHDIRHHAKHFAKSSSTTPAKAIELSDRLSELLHACEAPQELWPAGPEVLDRLQNYRLLENRTTALDLPGEPKLQIVNDTLVGEALPSFEELIVQVAASVGDARATYDILPDNLIGEFWAEGIHHPSPGADEVLKWLSKLLQEHDETRTSKILNLSPQIAFPSGRLDPYLEAKKSFLHRHSITPSSEDIVTELNITPAFSCVHIHHDEDVVISTARTIKPRTWPASSTSIAKIWIVWPPHHIHTLFQRGSKSSYGDTAYSLDNADGAVWFAQRDGETVVLPGDLAHCTFTLQSCYLVSSSCPGVSLARVPLIPSDIAAGTTEHYAVTRLVNRVESALQGSLDDSRQFMRHFWSESAYNMPVLRRNKSGYDTLIKLLVSHLRRERKCISCAALGIVSTGEYMANAKRHVQLHAENEISNFQQTKHRRSTRNLRRAR